MKPKKTKKKQKKKQPFLKISPSFVGWDISEYHPNRMQHMTHSLAEARGSAGAVGPGTSCIGLAAPAVVDSTSSSG